MGQSDNWQMKGKATNHCPRADRERHRQGERQRHVQRGTNRERDEQGANQTKTNIHTEIQGGTETDRQTEIVGQRVR